MLIDKTGYFKAEVLDSGVGVTQTSELPQFVVEVAAKEYYNGTTSEFEDCSEDEQTLTGYLVLVSKAGKDTLNADQMRKVTGWDGKSFAELDSMDLAGSMVLIRVDENEYEGKISMQVGWIDTPDATPGYQIKKLDKKALKSLDAKYKRKGKATPVKTAAAAKKKSGPPKTTKTPTGKCTKDDAWDFLMSTEMWADEVDGEPMQESLLTQLWTDAVTEMGDNEDEFTDDDWFIIRERVRVLVFKF